MREDIRHLFDRFAVEIPENGQTVRGSCPLCGGGSRQDSFSMIRISPTTCLWKCFRASCGAAGKHTVVGGAALVTQNPGNRDEEGVLSAPDWQEASIDSETANKVWEKYRLLPTTLSRAGVRRLASERHSLSLIVPVCDHRGREKGRALYGIEKKVRYSYIRPGREFQGAWFMPEGDKPRDRRTVLVEDVMSAMRASQDAGVCSVALLGTSIPYSVRIALLIHAGEGGDIVLMLDSDAGRSAIKAYRESKALLPGMRIQLLRGHDIKDMQTSEEVCEAIWNTKS